MRQLEKWSVCLPSVTPIAARKHSLSHAATAAAAMARLMLVAREARGSSYGIMIHN